MLYCIVPYCTVLSCIVTYYTVYTILYYTMLYYTILYCTVLYYTVLCYSILYYIDIYICSIILYYTILYYTQVGPGDRPAPPGGRPAPRCSEDWGAATPPSGGSGGQSTPGSLNYSADRMSRLAQAAIQRRTALWTFKKDSF